MTYYCSYETAGPPAFPQGRQVLVVPGNREKNLIIFLNSLNWSSNLYFNQKHRKGLIYSLLVL